MNRKKVAIYLKQLRKLNTAQAGRVRYWIYSNIKTINKAGAYFIGIQQSDGQAEPDLYLFNEPLKDSTLALYEDNITIETVSNKIKTFADKTKE